MVESDTFASAAAVPAPRNGSPGRPGAPDPDRPDPGDRHRFDVVMRGYERAAVDEHLARVAAEAAALRRELAESERRRMLAEQHAVATEGDNRVLRSEQQHGDRTAPEEGFGFRAERLLRLAEQEAADVRAVAAREAAALREQARAEAEQHRHEVEQNLIARSSVLDQQSAQRAAELQAREQQIAVQVAAAQADIEGMHSAARRAAEQQTKKAEADAEAIRARAAHDARRVHDQAAQEAARLGSLRDGTRAELIRLRALLDDGLRPPDARGPSGAGAAARPAPAPAADR